jgi:hypothetical protein
MNFKKRKIAVVLKATEIYKALVCGNDLTHDDYDTRNLAYYREAYHILPENCPQRAKGVKILDNKNVLRVFVQNLCEWESRWENKLIKAHPFLIFMAKIVTSRIYCGVFRRKICSVEIEIDKILTGVNYISLALCSFGDSFFAENGDNYYLSGVIKELVLENLEKRRKAALKRLK